MPLVAAFVGLFVLVVWFLFGTQIGRIVLCIGLVGMFLQWLTGTGEYAPRTAMIDSEVPQYLHANHLIAQDQTVRGFHHYVMIVSVTNSNPTLTSPDKLLWVACRATGVAHETNTDNVLGTFENFLVFEADAIDTVHGHKPQIIPPNTTMNIQFDQESGPYRVLKSATILDDCVVGADAKQAEALLGYSEEDGDHRTRMLTVTPLAQRKYDFKTGYSRD